VVEYHGREMLVQARMPDGQAIYFRTEKRLESGEKATISVPPDRVLIYPADEPAAPQEVAL
jgi:putative spermidine/putrescine transport system ATP-binding protein